MKKLVISNRSALSKKYGSQGFANIHAALQSFAAADATRGIATVIEFLDISPALPQANRVHAPDDYARTKTAVDHLCQHHGEPDYLMLMGAPDVVAHYPLNNPLPVGTDPHQDPDPQVWSDLPYACYGGSSSEIKDYLGPARAIGRMPDIQGGRDSHYLIDLLDAAARHAPRAFAQNCLSLSAKVWSTATKEVSRRALGRTVPPRKSPPENSPVPPNSLASGLHILNCHGAQSDPSFYGDDGTTMPTAITSSELLGNVDKGAVVAAECCYGAELYPMDMVAMAACNTYLKEGAIGYLGSTTVAYGAVGARLCCADVICCQFLKAVIRGASLGRALLQARLHFLATAKPYSGIELKTIAQFVLLGDPSLRAFLPTKPAKPSKKAKGIALAQSSLRAPSDARSTMQTHATGRAALIHKGHDLSTWARATELQVSRPARTASKSTRGKQPSGKVYEWHWVAKGSPKTRNATEIAQLEFLIPDAVLPSDTEAGAAHAANKAAVRRSEVREQAQPAPGPRRVEAVVTKFRGNKQVGAFRIARR